MHVDLPLQTKEPILSLRSSCMFLSRNMRRERVGHVVSGAESVEPQGDGCTLRTAIIFTESITKHQK